MASRTVSVLAPNGRRQTVRCTLNTTILHILEEVCQKQGFNPIEYDIKHHNKALDTSMTVQFSGLPNNAQLELGPAAKTREESEVTVALSLEDGTRVLGTFVPSNTLQDILQSLCDNAEPNPVVIYMRRELYGEELFNTDLRSLGITGGRAMLRVIHKTPEELKTQANVSAIIPPKPIEEKPYRRVFQPIDTEDNKNQPDSKSLNTEEHSSNDHQILPTPKNISAQPNILKLAKERKKVEENVIANNEEVLKPDKGRTIIKEGRSSISGNNVSAVGNSMSSTGNNQTPTENQRDIKLEDFPFIGERRGLIFHLESAQAQPREDPPDEFFNLTIDDAKAILRDVRKTREEAEEGGPMLTAALRQLEESKKQLRQLNKYNKCIIRVLFPDRTVLQAVFSATESVKSVLDFVAEHLANVIPFYLYTTPPKYVLPEDKGLVEVNCVPRALLHFGTDDQYKNVPLGYLREDLKPKYTTNSIASLAAVKIREEIKRNREKVITEDSDDGTPIAGCSRDSDVADLPQAKRNSNTSEKVPKWFKGT